MKDQVLAVITDPNDNTVVIKATEAGVIASIDVTVGEEISEDQLLLTFNNNSVKSPAGLVKSSVAAGTMVQTGDVVATITVGGTDIDITAQNNGTIRNIVSAGDVVGSGQLILSYEGGELEIADSTIRGYTKGAVYVANSNASMTVDNTTFTGNEAVDGAAINYQGQGTATITDSTFYQNKATGNGGALYLDKNSSMITVRGSTFTENSAANGGAAYVTAPNLLMDLNYFAGNTATANGGALYIASYKSNASAMDCTVRNSTFYQNEATGNGGAVYLDAGTVNYKNACISFENVTAYNNTAQNGGAFYLGNFDVVNMANCTIVNNTANAANGGHGIKMSAEKNDNLHVFLYNSIVVNAAITRDGNKKIIDPVIVLDTYQSGDDTVTKGVLSGAYNVTETNDVFTVNEHNTAGIVTADVFGSASPLLDQNNLLQVVITTDNSSYLDHSGFMLGRYQDGDVTRFAYYTGETVWTGLTVTGTDNHDLKQITSALAFDGTGFGRVGTYTAGAAQINPAVAWKIDGVVVDKYSSMTEAEAAISAQGAAVTGLSMKELAEEVAKGGTFYLMFADLIFDQTMTVSRNTVIYGRGNAISCVSDGKNNLVISQDGTTVTETVDGTAQVLTPNQAYGVLGTAGFGDVFYTVTASAITQIVCNETSLFLDASGKWTDSVTVYSNVVTNLDGTVTITDATYGTLNLGLDGILKVTNGSNQYQYVTQGVPMPDTENFGNVTFVTNGTSITEIHYANSVYVYNDLTASWSVVGSGNEDLTTAEDKSVTLQDANGTGNVPSVIFNQDTEHPNYVQETTYDTECSAAATDVYGTVFYTADANGNVVQLVINGMIYVRSASGDGKWEPKAGGETVDFIRDNQSVSVHYNNTDFELDPSNPVHSITDGNTTWSFTVDENGKITEIIRQYVEHFVYSDYTYTDVYIYEQARAVGGHTGWGYYWTSYTTGEEVWSSADFICTNAYDAKKVVVKGKETSTTFSGDYLVVTTDSIAQTLESAPTEQTTCTELLAKYAQSVNHVNGIYYVYNQVGDTREITSMVVSLSGLSQEYTCSYEPALGRYVWRDADGYETAYITREDGKDIITSNGITMLSGNGTTDTTTERITASTSSGSYVCNTSTYGTVQYSVSSSSVTSISYNNASYAYADDKWAVTADNIETQVDGTVVITKDDDTH